jgi:hypothetical protein
MLFFHSWPEEINEGLQTQWQSLPFSGASGPLAFVYRGNTWQDYSVKLHMHTSNPLFPAIGFKNAGGASIFSLQGAALAILDVMRIQMQVAWCKSICLPANDTFKQLAENTIKSLTRTGQTFEEFLKAAGQSLEGVFSTLSSSMSQIGDLGPYVGTLFPPMIETHYGGFLRLHGFCNSVNIRWLPPFVPLAGYPHRAEVTLNFQRFFPYTRTPTRTMARTLLGRLA